MMNCNTENSQQGLKQMSNGQSFNTERPKQSTSVDAAWVGRWEKKVQLLHSLCQHLFYLSCVHKKDCPVHFIQGAA